MLMPVDGPATLDMMATQRSPSRAGAKMAIWMLSERSRSLLLVGRLKRRFARCSRRVAEELGTE